jgi:2'-5' RNA ligase
MSSVPASKLCPGLHNLFFAIRPPEETAREIMEVAASLGLGGTPVRADRLHISLLALVWKGVVPEGLIEEAADVAQSVAMPPMRVILDRIVGGSSSALLRPSEPLETLRMFRERLGFAMKNAGVDFELGGRFAPHVTLLYGGQPMPEKEIDPITWTIEEFVLIDSHIGLTHHEIVGRWPMRG